MPVPSTTTTKLAQLINPQVMGAFIARKIEAKLIFTPIAVVGHELVGRAGDTLTMPKWNYIGKAVDVGEGEDITLRKMGQTSTTVTVKKAGLGVQITDEAVLSGLGDVIGEAENQLAESVADKINADCLDTLLGATTLVHTTSTSGKIDANDLVNALVKFKEDIDVNTVLYVSPTSYGQLRGLAQWETVAQGQKWITGQVGQLMGCSVVVTNSLEDKSKFLLCRAGCLGIQMKREFMLETDRDIITKSTIITVDKHYVSYLRDELLVLVGTIKA